MFELVDVLPALVALAVVGVLRTALRRKASSRREALRATRRSIRRGAALLAWFVGGAFVVALSVRLATADQHEAAVAAGCYEAAFVVLLVGWELVRVSRLRRAGRGRTPVDGS